VSSGASSTIGRAKLDGTDVDPSFITVASSPTGGPVGVAVDAAHVYWTNSYTNSIGRAKLDGTDVDPSFIRGARGPWGMARTPRISSCPSRPPTAPAREPPTTSA
jgi:virginiamycin B lyase